MYNSQPCLVDSCLAPGSCVFSAPSPTVFSDPWREYRWSHLWPSARSRLWLALSRAVRQSLRLSLYPLQSEASQTKVGRAPVDGQTHLDGSPVKGPFRKKQNKTPDPSIGSSSSFTTLGLQLSGMNCLRSGQKSRLAPTPTLDTSSWRVATAAWGSSTELRALISSLPSSLPSTVQHRLGRSRVMSCVL